MVIDQITSARRVAESGELKFDGVLITYTSQLFGSFMVSLTDVAAIGEFTNEDGPNLDDWFLVLVHRNGSEWFDASMYAVGVEFVCERLSVALGALIKGELANSTHFASRVLWPPERAGRSLFIFRAVTPVGWLHRVQLFLLPRVVRSLYPDGEEAVGGASLMLVSECLSRQPKRSAYFGRAALALATLQAASLGYVLWALCMTARQVPEGETEGYGGAVMVLIFALLGVGQLALGLIGLVLALVSRWRNEQPRWVYETAVAVYGPAALGMVGLVLLKSFLERV